MENRTALMLEHISLWNKDYMRFWTLGLDSTQTLRLWWERENRAKYLLSGSRITHSTSSQISYKHCDTATSTLFNTQLSLHFIFNQECTLATRNVNIQQVIYVFIFMYLCIYKSNYQVFIGGPYLLLSNFSIICTVIKFDSHTTPMYNFNTEHQLRLPAQQAVETGGVQVAATSHSPQIGRKDAPWWPFHLPTPPLPPDRATLHISQTFTSQEQAGSFFVNLVSTPKKIQALPFDGDTFSVFIFFGSFLFFW